MKTALFIRPTCLQSNALKSRLCHNHFRSFLSTRSPFRPCFSLRSIFHRPPPPPGRRTLVAAALSPVAFIAISEQDQHDGKTGEEHMLEASRAEIRDALPDAIAHSSRLTQRIYFVLDAYVREPLCTGLRFLHLVVIFVPVLLSVPMVWVGRRRKGRSGEREGCLWWYGFLVSSMERAGAAFIKVCH